MIVRRWCADNRSWALQNLLLLGSKSDYLTHHSSSFVGWMDFNSSKVHFELDLETVNQQEKNDYHNFHGTTVLMALVSVVAADTSSHLQIYKPRSQGLID
jgi:hypothetical protein